MEIISGLISDYWLKISSKINTIENINFNKFDNLWFKWFATINHNQYSHYVFKNQSIRELTGNVTKRLVQVRILD